MLRFSALDPFFDIVRQGLADLVDGDHYFDTIASDAVFEFRYSFPGYPTKIVGREALLALYARSTALHPPTPGNPTGYWARRCGSAAHRQHPVRARSGYGRSLAHCCSFLMRYSDRRDRPPSKR